LKLTQLRYFLAVAQELHFGRAAERAHIEQSPLSRQIRLLEDELGVALFLRIRHRVELTEAGRALVPEAQAILEATERARRSVLQAQEGMMGRLTVGYTHLAIYTLLPRVLVEYRRRYPRVELVLRDNILTPEQIDLLSENRIDLGVVRPPVRNSGIGLLTLLRENLVIALADDHPLAACKSVTMAQLADASFVCFERTLDSALQTLILRAGQESGFQPRIVQEVGDIPTMLALVAAGMGIALVPSSARHVRYKGVVFRRMVGGGPALEMALAWNKHTDSRLRSSFVATANEVLAQSVT